MSWSLPVRLTQVEDLKAKLAVQEVELWQRNTDIEALIAKIGQQTDKLNQERAVADAEEQKVPDHGVSFHTTKEQKSLSHVFHIFVPSGCSDPSQSD